MCKRQEQRVGKLVEDEVQLSCGSRKERQKRMKWNVVIVVKYPGKSNKDRKNLKRLFRLK